ncbi:HVO_0758 family zinc finger protein [Halomicrococcus gelatinilyticus]|jgi:ribosomal protein L33|uniref:HVO_0758 family zinc finger protein n=1 Tax=Halomicrococcus gelatinilyticus TaxID=1702103 RepID=UPI002E14A341
MNSVRSALRDGEVEKDTYGRLTCTECDESVKTRNDPDEVFTVKYCPECGAEWKEL